MMFGRYHVSYLQLPRRLLEQLRKSAREFLVIKPMLASDSVLDECTLFVDKRSPWKGSQKHVYDKWFLMDCVAYTCFLRSVKKTEAASEAHIRVIFGQHADQILERMAAKQFTMPAYSCLRVSRLRFQCACTLFSRYFKPSTGDALVSHQLMIDASRSFGRECLAVIELTLVFADDTAPPSVTVKRLPMSTLAHKRMNTADKAIAVLQAAWLAHGPSSASLQEWLRSVHVSPVDLGNESKVISGKNALVQFMRIDPASAANEEFSELLFPNVLKVGGTNHMVDNIVKHVSEHLLPWFPRFAANMDTFTGVVCVDTYRDAIKRFLLQRGEGDAALLFDKGKPSTFNQQRWGSIVICARLVMVFKHVAALFVDGLRLVGESLRLFTALRDGGNRFFAECEFVVVIFGPLEELRGWCKGCPCHEDDLRAGKNVVCDLKGLRLRFLWDRVQQCCSEVRAVAETLVPNHPALVQAGLVEDALACASSVAANAQLKFGYLDRVPAKLARLRNSSTVAAECVRETDAYLAKGVQLDPVSARFFAPGGQFRQDVDEYVASHSLAPQLSLHIRPYELGKIDESLVEGEHRSMNQEKQRAHATRHCFAQATRDSDHNASILKLARGNSQARQVLERCWKTWKLVAETPGISMRGGRVRAKIRKMKPREVRERMYRLGDVSFADWSFLNANFQERAPKQIALRDCDDLLLHLLLSQLSNGTVYSVPTAEDDEWPAAIALYTADGRIRGAPHAMTGELLEQLVPRRFVFRVERLTPSNAKLVEQPKFKEALGRTLIQIQPMSSWAALETLSSMSLIASGAPRFVDVRHLAPIGVFRTALRKWSYAGLSDAYGCYEYRSSGFCCPDMESEFHPLPVACKLDILASAPFAWFFVF
jgi:hypothetical protein